METLYPLALTPHSSLRPLATMNLFSISMDLPVLDISYQRSQCVPFQVCLLSHSARFSRFTRVIATELHFFCGWVIFHSIETTPCLSIPQMMDIWVTSTFRLLWICGHEQLCARFSVLLDTHLEVGLLDHMATLHLAFWWNATLFCAAATPFYIPIGSAQRSQLLYSLSRTCWIIAISVVWPGIL